MPRDQIIRDQHRKGFDELHKLWERFDDLEAALNGFSETALSFVEEPIERVLERLKSFEPSVSVIGQVKAGKSTLMNALIGETDLLPSDVNPWTSVITGIHLNSRHRPPNTRALFRFFDAHEWDRLVSTGGRLGEMANRAGFEAEADEVKAQVQEMRQTTEERLGDEFSELLGSSHAFEDIDKTIIDRYICYGDPEEMEGDSQEGVYADLTKTADLFIELPGYPRGLCLRDTPGVNDTFMMREQITLNAISESRVCVVVLSAHQALSTMDMALLRIICSVKAREVLIFVNRIDELRDPLSEMPKIEASIEKTLSRLGVGEGIQVLFGSGYWANSALDDRCDKMAPASRASLVEWAKNSDFDTDDSEGLREAAMAASGVGALHQAIAKRIVEGPGKAVLQEVTNEIETILEMNKTVVSVADRKVYGDVDEHALDAEAIRRKQAAMEAGAVERFEKDSVEIRSFLKGRLEHAQSAFVNSALEALDSHIKNYGGNDTWNHDPISLRMMMRSAFMTSCTKLRRKGEERIEEVLDQVEEIMQHDLGVFQEDSNVEIPLMPEPKSPTGLARTLSLDLQAPWWRKFWGFGGRKSAVQRYKTLLISETTPLIDELLTDFYDIHAAKVRETVNDFAHDQGRFIAAILECIEGEGEGAAAAVPGGPEGSERSVA